MEASPAGLIGLSAAKYKMGPGLKVDHETAQTQLLLMEDQTAVDSMRSYSHKTAFLVLKAF